jgi:hypothetical protein
MVAYSQEIILSEEAKNVWKRNAEYHQLRELAQKNAHLSDSILNALEIMFKVDEEKGMPKIPYCNIGDIFAEYGYYDKAIFFYDLAFKKKQFTYEEFKVWYREKWFANDTLLYQQKCIEYFENSPTQFTPTEMVIKLKIKEMWATDQMARNYYSDFPNEKKLTENNLIVYVDTINKRKIIELLNNYPEIENPLDLENFAHWLFGRHLFTAYPEFWLEYFEPIAKRQLLKGQYHIQTYARTYDRCMITSGRAEYSIYGEWDNDGKNVNPDSVGVDRRRVNLGLPRMEDKPNDEKIIFLTY